jgi:serine kinase of HPr protein (carbohydrate metabolism regulator)
VILHAGLIARRVRGYWRGALIEGPAGSGKSDLALRALAAGFRLVADDRVLAFVCDGQLYGRAPDTLAGLIEARGVGVLSRNPIAYARIALRVRCVRGPDDVERVPVPETTLVLGVDVPTEALWALGASAPDKLTAALERLGAAG